MSWFESLKTHIASTWDKLFATPAKSLIKIKGKVKKKPAPSAPAPVVVSSKIENLLNDLTTASLVQLVDPPVNVVPPINVRNYRGAGFNRGTVEWQAANCYVTLAETLQFYRGLAEVPLNRWAGVSTLTVLPRAGLDLNAFYNRKSLQFFHYSSTKTGTIFTVDSADIVAHELGHAILDSYRPDTWSAASLEVASFHEAFGDFTAMMHAMKYNEVLNHVITETGGNLRKSNVISRLAEQFGTVIGKLSNVKKDCLRSAINNFRYVNPGTLPEDANDDQLAAECHSFSRIFLGALYDIWVMMVEDQQAAKKSLLEAMKVARDYLARYMIKAIQNVPLNARFYEAMAKTLLWADVTLSNRKYHDRMQAIFLKRNIVTPQVRILSAPKCESDELKVQTGGIMRIKLGDVLLRAQSDNPLYDAELEIPAEGVYLYDQEKNIYDVLAASDQEAISAAQDFITHLHAMQAVSDAPNTPFEVTDGKLVRTHFVCGHCH